MKNKGFKKKRIIKKNHKKILKKQIKILKCRISHINFNKEKKKGGNIFEIKWKDIAFGEYTDSDIKSPIM